MRRLSDLSEAQMHTLKALAMLPSGWTGMRPGSNFWPLKILETPIGEVNGEDIDALERKGLVSAGKAKVEHIIEADAEVETPDIDLDYDWGVTPASRLALQGGTGDA